MRDHSSHHFPSPIFFSHLSLALTSSFLPLRRTLSFFFHFSTLSRTHEAMPLITTTTLSSKRFLTRSLISVVATLWLLYVFFRKNNTTPKLTYQATSSFIDGQGLYVLGGLSVQTKKKAVTWSSSLSSTTTRISAIPSQAFMIDLSVPWSAAHPVYKTLAPGPRFVTSTLKEHASSSSDTTSISSAITADRQHWFLLTTSITAKKKDSNKGTDSGGSSSKSSKSSKSTGYLYHFESKTWKEIPVDSSLSKNALSPSALTFSFFLPIDDRSQHYHYHHYYHHHHQGTTDPDTGVIYMFLRHRPCHPDNHDCDQQPPSSSISPRGMISKDATSFSTPWWLWSINIHTKTLEFVKDVPPASVVHGMVWSPYRKELLYISNSSRSRNNKRSSSSSNNINSKDNTTTTTTHAARRDSGVENQTTSPSPGWFAYHPNNGWKDLTFNTTLSSSPSWSWSPPHRKGACFVPAYDGSKMVLFGGFKVQVEEGPEVSTEENDNGQRKTKEKKKTKTRNKKSWIDDEIAQSDIYILDVKSLTWSKGPTLSRLNARAYSACAASGDHFIAWGGIHRIVHGDTITTTPPHAPAAAASPPPSVADVTFPVDAVVIFSLVSGTWVSRYAPPGMDSTHLEEPFWYKYTDFQMCFHAGHCQEFMIGCLFLGQCILTIAVAAWWYYLRGRWSHRRARLYKSVPKV